MDSSESDSRSGRDQSNDRSKDHEDSQANDLEGGDTPSENEDGETGAWISVSETGEATPERSSSDNSSLPVAAEDLRPVTAATDAIPTDPEPLPTYNTNIDNTFESGFVPGSVLAIEGPPQSKSDVLVANLISGGNPVVYFSGIRSTDAVQIRLDQLKTIPADERHIFDMTGWDIDEFVTVLEELELAQPATVVIDPITMVETDADREVLVEVMRTLKETLGNHSLGIVHCVTPDSPPQQRWVTLQLADTLFEVRHDPGRETPNLLYINRLHPKQTFGGKGREFDLEGDLELDLTYDESLSTPTG